MTPFYVSTSKGAESTIFYTFGIDQSNVIVFIRSYWLRNNDFDHVTF